MIGRSTLYRLTGLMVTAGLWSTFVVAITEHSTALWTYVVMAYVTIRADQYGVRLTAWLHRRDFEEHNADMIARMNGKGWDLVDAGDGYAYWTHAEPIDLEEE